MSVGNYGGQILVDVGVGCQAFVCNSSMLHTSQLPFLGLGVYLSLIKVNVRGQTWTLSAEPPGLCPGPIKEDETIAVKL